YDNALHFSRVAEEKTMILQKLNIEDKRFVLATIHRNHNTDKAERLTTIFNAISRLAEEEKMPFIIPLHPRTRKMLGRQLPKALFEKLSNSPKIQIIEPVSFLDMTLLEKKSMLIMTDSGGVQKESYFYHKPCIILRPETEWVEIVENGSALIADADEEKILGAYRHFQDNPPSNFPPIYGDGKAAWFILDKISKQ
ncbi:MAG TPA: UDP-N-acetylglucosamine 2-epimerase, partial [Bacteroidales bacterium]|nr:UDP-N-acetylglucosamine 2-epimerase [Bacteroidales bacterium]